MLGLAPIDDMQSVTYHVHLREYNMPIYSINANIHNQKKIRNFLTAWLINEVKETLAKI